MTFEGVRIRTVREHGRSGRTLFVGRDIAHAGRFYDVSRAVRKLVPESLRLKVVGPVAARIATDAQTSCVWLIGADGAEALLTGTRSRWTAHRRRLLECLRGKPAEAATANENRLLCSSEVGLPFRVSAKALHRLLCEREIIVPAKQNGEVVWFLTRPYRDHGYDAHQTLYRGGKTFSALFWTKTGKEFVHRVLRAAGLAPVDH